MHIDLRYGLWKVPDSFAASVITRCLGTEAEHKEKAFTSLHVEVIEHSVYAAYLSLTIEKTNVCYVLQAVTPI